jgi:hypothetical protein
MCRKEKSEGVQRKFLRAEKAHIQFFKSGAGVQYLFFRFDDLFFQKNLRFRLGKTENFLKVGGAHPTGGTALT